MRHACKLFCTRSLAAAAVLTLCLPMIGCRALPTTAGLPTQHRQTADQLVIHSDFSLPAEQQIIDELVAGRQRLHDKLDLPDSKEPIHVYLFKEPQRYRQFMLGRYPQFPDRRAFFVRNDVGLAVYAHWNDRVAEDLRHEVTHGYLHAAVPDWPLWLDEGLAEYCEVPAELNGLNRPHLAMLLERFDSGAWQPNLVRLETFTNSGELEQLDYAEAWAWVYWLLEGDGPHQSTLAQFVHQLKSGDAHEPLSTTLARTVDDPARQLSDFLRTLR